MTQDALRAYLKQIGRHPLLTATEEIELARQVQVMVAPPPALPEVEMVRITAAGVRAKNRLIQSNLRLVVAIARKYQNRGIEMANLIQESTIGLEWGVVKFDSAFFGLITMVLSLVLFFSRLLNIRVFLPFLGNQSVLS